MSNKDFTAAMWAEGEIIEENKTDHRIWPETIDGRWLYPGELVIEYKDCRYVVNYPAPVKRKDL